MQLASHLQLLPLSPLCFQYLCLYLFIHFMLIAVYLVLLFNEIGLFPVCIIILDCRLTFTFENSSFPDCGHFLNLLFLASGVGVETVGIYQYRILVIPISIFSSPFGCCQPPGTLCCLCDPVIHANFSVWKQIADVEVFTA